MLGQTNCSAALDKPIFRLFEAEILCFCRLAKFATTQKALIPLHFGNPELHNKLLAFRHPNMG